MYTEEEILDKLSFIIKKDKEFERKTKREQKKLKVPEYYPEYPKIVDVAERLSYHYDMDVFPEKILKEKAPNQQIEEWEYAKNNYKPVTVPFWGKAESSLGRIWNKDNYSIKFTEDASKFKDNTSKDYFTMQIPFYRSISNFMENICTSATLRDPNALLCVKPRILPSKKDEDGNLVNDQTQLIEPIPVIYRAEQIVSYEQDDHAMILLDEKSIVKRAGKKVKEGNIYAFYDEKNIWSVIQVGDILDHKYEIELFYEHGLNEYPFKKLSGKPVEKMGLNYNISYFMDAIPNLDDAIANYVTLMLSIYTQAFPQRWAVTDRCREVGCINGRVQDGKGEWGNCKSCNGTGKVGKKSPTGEYEIELPSKLGNGEMPPTPPFGYVSPDPAILEFLKNHINDTIIDAFGFLNIDVSNSKVKGSDTALSKQIDREEFFSFLVQISNQMFIRLEWLIHMMGAMRYEGFEDPEIIKPTNFTIRSFEEITEEMARAKESGVPDIALIKLLDEYSNIRFNTDKEFGKMLDIAMKLDKLIVKNSQEILVGLNTGTITKKDVIIHNCFMQFIERGIEEDVDFLDKDIKEITEFISEQADIKLAETKPSPRSTEDILSIANNGAPRPAATEA